MATRLATWATSSPVSTRGALALLLLATLAFSPRAAWACGGGDPCDSGCYSAFSPENLVDGWCLRCGADRYSASREDLDQANIKEWSEYFHNDLSASDLSELVYVFDTHAVDELIFALKGQKVTLHGTAESLRQAIESSKQKESAIKALYYLGFAKRCEPIAMRDAGREYWQEPAPRTEDDQKKLEDLIKGGKRLLENGSDPALLARYQFQILRLLFYSGQYAEAHDYYVESQMEKIAAKSLKYRAMQFAAGSLYRDKQYGKANYLFSLIFDQYPPLSTSAYLSFHPQEQSDWETTLKLAQSPRERAVLWQMFGFYADPVEAMRHIYEIDPKSALLTPLLVHELQEVEGKYDWERDTASKQDAQDIATLKSIADERHTVKPALWLLGLGHLYALARQPALADQYLSKAAALDKSPAFQDQARISRLMNALLALKAPEKKREPYFAAEMAWAKENESAKRTTIESWAYIRLSSVYQASDKIRSIMLHDHPDDSDYLNNDFVDGLLKLVSGAKTAFDKMLVAHYGDSPDDLLEVKGINLLYAGEFAKAVAAFGARKESPPAALPADPFMIHIRDCHDCDAEAPNKDTYSKLTLARKLLTLSQQAKASTEAGAKASFELGNALYNMSYYGNSRAVYAAARESATEAYRYQLDKALEAYRHAAEASQDPELKAKATFMAAKCEQDKYDSTDPQPATKPHEYFRQLKETFSKTKFYQEALKECSFFKSYVLER